MARERTEITGTHFCTQLLMWSLVTRIYSFAYVRSTLLTVISSALNETLSVLRMMSWMQHFPNWFGLLQPWLELAYSICLVSLELQGEHWGSSKIKCVYEIWQTELGHIHDFLCQKTWTKAKDFLNFHSALDKQYLEFLGTACSEKFSTQRPGTEVRDCWLWHWVVSASAAQRTSPLTWCYVDTGPLHTFGNTVIDPPSILYRVL